MCNHRNPQGRVPKHPPDHNLDATVPITRPVRDPEVCTLADLDAVRYEVARADVLAMVAHEHFDRTVWREGERVDFVAHLVAAASEAASAALLAVDNLHRAVASRAVPGAEIWTDG